MDMISEGMTNYPDKVIATMLSEEEDGHYAVEYKDYPHVGIPDSWGTKAHALKYMAALLGMSYEQYQICRERLK